MKRAPTPGTREPAVLPPPAGGGGGGRLYDRSFLLTFVSQLSFVLANTLMAHYARWIEWLGGGVREVGWIMGAGAVAGLFLRPWLGQWINRLGSRTMWALGYALFAAGAAGNIPLSGMSWTIYLLRALLALGAAVVFASSLTYVSQIAPARRRTEAIGTLGAAGFIGMLTGPLLGDLILGGGTRTRGDFTFLFATASLALILPSVLLLFLRTPRPQRGAPVRIRDFLATARHHWPGSILLVNVVFGVCMSVPFGFLATFIDSRGLEIDGMSEIGLFFVSYAGWGLAVRLGLRQVPDRIGRRRVLLAGLLFEAAGMFAFLLVSPERAGWLLLPGLLGGTGHALIFHTMTSLALDPFPKDVRGTGAALSLMLLDTGMVAGAPVLGQVADRWGYGALFATVGSACLAAAALYAWRSLPLWRARRDSAALSRPSAGSPWAGAGGSGPQAAAPPVTGTRLAGSAAPGGAALQGPPAAGSRM